MTFSIVQAAAGFGDVPGMALQNPQMFEVGANGLVHIEASKVPRTRVVLAGAVVLSERRLSATATEKIVQIISRSTTDDLPHGSVLLVSVLGLDAADETEGQVPVRTVITTNPAEVAAWARVGSQPETMAIVVGDPSVIAHAADFIPAIVSAEPEVWQRVIGEPSRLRVARNIGIVWGLVSTAGAALGAYHGYKRNRSVGWALGWALLGGLVPVITVPVSLAQGFGKPKAGRLTANKRRRRARRRRR